MHRIKSVDFIGERPFFLINGNDKFKTFWGALISSLLTIYFLSCLGFYVYYSLSKSVYTLLASEEFNSFPYKSWLNPEWSVILLDKYMGNIPERERIYQVTGQFWYNKEHTYENGTKYFKIDITDVELEECDLDKHFKKSKDLWRDQKLINSSYCIKPGQDLNSTHVFGENNYTGIVIWLHKFQNDTSKNKTDCLDPDLIHNKLENVFVLTRFRDYYFDHLSDSDFAIPYVYSDQTQASSTGYKRTWYYFQNIDYYSDSNLFYPNEKKHKYSNLKTTRDAYDLRTYTTVTDSFAVISLNTYQLKTVYRKNYYKLTKALGDLGGIIKITMLVVSLIKAYFNETVYFNELINLTMKDYYIKKSVIKENLSINYQSDLNETLLIRNILTTGKDYNKEKNLHRRIITNNTNLLKIKDIMFKRCISRCCKESNRRVNLYDKMQNILKQELEISNIIHKNKMIDKLMFIIAGYSNKNIFEDSINPYDNEFEKNYRKDSEPKLGTSNILTKNWEENFKFLEKLKIKPKKKKINNL